MADADPHATPAGGRRKPAATIYDIARRTGFSPSTVSRALNKPGRINIETERRIRAAAEDLGYRTNPMARALPTGRTGTLALLLSDITNPVYFDLVRGAEHVTAAEGYTLVLAESQESPAVEAEAAHRLLLSADGLVLVASRLPDDEVRDLSAHKPLVVVNREVEGVPGLVADIGPGIRATLDHLADQGHRALVYLSGPAASWPNRLRWDMLLDEAPRRRMTIVEIGPGDPTLDGGASALRRVTASGATAVLAYNDLMAIGLLHACRDAGVDVPRQLSIVGFDDIFGSSFTTPAITTVRSPLGELGAAAVRRLIGEVDGARDTPGTPLVTELVLRDSTAPPPA